MLNDVFFFQSVVNDNFIVQIFSSENHCILSFLALLVLEVDN